MSRTCTPILVGVASPVSEVHLPFKNSQISLLGHRPWSMPHGPCPMDHGHGHGPWAWSMGMGMGMGMGMVHGPWAWSMVHGHGPWSMGMVHGY